MKIVIVLVCFTSSYFWVSNIKYEGEVVHPMDLNVTRSYVETLPSIDNSVG